MTVGVALRLGSARQRCLGRLAPRRRGQPRLALTPTRPTTRPARRHAWLDATDAHGFTDVSDGHAFGEAINCIAYYGITNGTGDGTTFSPNDDVSRQEMALFIARAAEAAGVDLGDAMDAGFSDIDDAWPGAQDAINRLASKGMIPKDDTFRPGDDITRAEMATFLIGLLNKASSNVTIVNGVIRLGASGSTTVADDHFGDSRATLPRANDAEVSALYELGITKGSTVAPVQDDTEPPLDFNYEPAGSVTRGHMAEFITRALGHTSVRPEGVSAQYDGSDVVVSVPATRTSSRCPTSWSTSSRPTPSGADLAYAGQRVLRRGQQGVGYRQVFECEIDGLKIRSPEATATRACLSVAWTSGGTVVWAWTGDDKDTRG